ncbi:pyruvate dehydrogenase complex dihydrolipoamide acetyltransferase [Blastochloris tepida]|uniref:Acetyltransferase component of pyruvate dehydrogenase complex n=1 Tax=Blastochloris tepida TaxID=2233851 RepID=A0A348G0V2_9HYPH|nr:pyruvate dehydrogenase complex dihydrolipoamide acetyltransferase [Blastochloris tepida]BBF93185.1 dihydrolipoyllysine-residue acetyltransferase component of pyruvate dehydrogenase complex [Blastochloris tepida]
MPIDILMPALSPTMEKGNLAKWLKKEGDSIKAGDVIAEIETDKATMEVEAADDGVLAKIMVPAGTADVPVNQVIAVLAGEGEDVAATATATSAKADAAPAGASDSKTAKDIKAQAAKPDSVSSQGSAPAQGQGSAKSAVAAAAAAGSAKSNGRVFASPLARRLAREAGLDLSTVSGSGPRGRIVMRDIEAVRGSVPPTMPATAPAAAPAPLAGEAPRPLSVPASDAAIRAMYAPGSFEEIPHDTMRKVIARRLTEAKTTIPHFYLTVDIELDALLALRATINANAPKRPDGEPAFKLSVNDFIIKALALALLRVPDANVTWTEGAMLRHRQADVGVAVAIPGGLITPVVRDAGNKPLSAISNEMKDFAARAKARRLTPEEYTGGATAVSNLGMFGVKEFAAVINPPHATLLAVGAGEPRPVVKDGQLAVATVMSATLSVDHRAVDGALGAQLLAAVKTYLEAPVTMLV